LRAIFAAKSLATFVVKLKFRATKVFVTARDFLYVVSAHIQTLVLVRVLVKQLLVRRR
jgi:hypothetical protein